MPDPKIYAKVKSVFDRYDIPTHIWYPIALAESNFDPNASGDSGASIGIFQINRINGQGIGYSADQLRDPIINAEIASRAIGSAYRAIKANTPIFKQAGEVARRSGHPGGSVIHPFDANDSRIKRIDELAAKFIAGGMSVNKSGQDGTSGTPIIADDLAQMVRDPITRALDEIKKLFAAVDFAGVGIASFGLILILLALAALVFENRDQIVKTGVAVAKVAAL